jgi:hypothetical protein
LYICDSPEGGYGQIEDQTKKSRQTIYGGVTYNSFGMPTPIGGENCLHMFFVQQQTTTAGFYLFIYKKKCTTQQNLHFVWSLPNVTAEAKANIVHEAEEIAHNRCHKFVQHGHL